MTPAVIYIRVSTNPQEDKYGPEVQEQICREYADSVGMNIVGVFQDTISGVKLFKPELSQAFEMCKELNIKTLLISDDDRFSRDLKVKLMIRDEFKEAGIRVINVSMPLTEDSAENTFVEQVFGALSELDRKKIIRRMYNGRKQTIKKGKYAGGKPPFGYTTNRKGALVPNEKHQTIQIVFNYHKEGLPFIEIARRLNEIGATTQTGKPFYAQSVKNIINSNISKGMVKYAGIVSVMN